jgi:hypothetical protein
MIELNKHISDYLTYYLNLKFSPHYAVMLTGKWGCGKTWLIKQFQEKCEASLKDKFLYISLYGANSCSEIDDEIFKQLHPKLSGEKAKLVGKILKGPIRAKLGLDVNPADFNDTTDKILVFDDLERCSLSMKQAMGYINSFVEHEGLKVIILTDEDKIKSSDQEDYKSIKEKVVGHSFKVVPDEQSAFDSFIQHIEDGKAKSFLENQKDKIFEIFHLSGYNNLRILRQSLLDFERFLTFVEDRFQRNNAFMKELLAFYMAFSFEIRAGEISASDIKELESDVVTDVFTKDKSNLPATTTGIIRRKYPFLNQFSFFNSYNLVLTKESWYEFFEKGFIEKESVSKSLTNSKYFEDENRPNWIKLWHYVDLDDEIFESILDAVEKQWKNREFTNPLEILHVAGVFLKLANGGIYNTTKDVMKSCTEYINDIKTFGAWSKYETHLFIDPDQAYGLGYHGSDLPEFGTLRDLLLKAITQTRTDKLPEIWKGLLEVMKNDPDKFGEMITRVSSYYEIPIFKSINPQEFLNALLQLGNSDMRIIGSYLHIRYEHDHIAGKLSSELAFLKQLERLLESEADKRKGKPSGINLNACKNEVRAAIQKLERFQTMNHNDEQTPQQLTD